MNTCMELANLLLNEVKPYVNQTFGDPEYDDDLDAIAEQFVDAVVLPTYKDLQEKNKLLLDAVNQFRQTQATTTSKRPAIYGSRHANRGKRAKLSLSVRSPT